jgi:streptomycin 6-kinase
VSAIISFNYLGLATSPDFGQVALKIGVPNSELYTEIEALTRYGGRHICRCHDSDLELGAMLLERLIPGRDLTTVSDHTERTHIAARLSAALPVPLVGQGGHPLPRVAEWASRAFARARRENICGSQMLSLIDTAEGMLGEIETPDRPLVLLHGDLNHWNILQDGDTWKAIDPKGAIGVRCMEAARYILNELEFLGPEHRQSGLAEMIRVIGAEMGESPHFVAACAFLDSVLSTCWSFEEYERRDLSAQVDQCGFLWEEYQRTAAGG